MKLNNIAISKIFGWILLLAGVALIGWTLLYSYNIFTGKADAPQILKLEAKAGGAPIKLELPAGEMDIQSLIQDQLKGILPTNSVPTLLNLIISSVLAGILIFGGSQISSLGIRLIK